MSENGNVIKKSALAKEAASAETRVVVKRPVVEARAEARRLLAEAEAEARELRETAERVARELREAAYEEGREAALLEFNQLLLDARERRDSAFQTAERDLLRLAVKLAEKIIGREVERDSGALADIVSTALRHARQSESLTVRVNPSDMPTVEAHRARLDPAGRARFVDLVPDPRVRPGGCVIESESGTVDAQLDTQLRVLERALLSRAPGED
ncbi:MAG TPA: type III secretion system stator protein SctL [Pyrinomonadaceae bacterium]|nr:type III secretion system stator protein SctL [Pyrinomonadaceae bacterium]